MPSLAEFTPVNQPIVFDLDDGLLTIRNRYHTLSTEHLRFVAIKEVDGYPTAEATLQVPDVQPERRATVTLPDDLVSPGDGETWLTVKAELAAPTPWADHGHEVALGQFELQYRAESRRCLPGRHRPLGRRISS